VKTKLSGYFNTNQVDVVNCGVNIECFSGGYPEKIPGRVLYVGRLVPYKNLTDLIEAVRIVRKTRPHASLLIVGSGPLEPIIREVESRADFVTFIRRAGEPEKIRHLRESEVLVLPSSEEGFGISLLEANAAFTPFVCYDIPALKEVATSLKGGLLVGHRNVEELAQGILSILEDRALAERLARTGRKSVESQRYSWYHVARRVEEVYRKALSTN
jgi:glycosyltransferase involved in cell wall biosynthesis